MCLVRDKNTYLKRLTLSSATVGASLLPGLVGFGVDAVLFPWFGMLFLMDSLKLFQQVDIHPGMLLTGCAAVTFLMLALAAMRPLASVVATVWFVANALGGWLLMATFRLEPAG